MLRDITLGQYYPVDSVIHRLDPRVKLVCTFLFIISLFMFSSIPCYVLAALFLFVVIKLSKVPFFYMLRGLKAVLVLLIVTFLFNIFLTPGTPIFSIWRLTITREGVHSAIFMALRLAFLIIGTSVMTLTTTPNALTDGLEKLFWPLNKINVPVHEMAMMMSIALRYIPILLEETDKIMKAQKARGADLESGNIIQKAKAMVPILVPLFISAFRRAYDLALAMEARCYHGGEGRTKMKPLHYVKRDYIAYVITLAYIVLMVFVGKMLPSFI